MMNATHVSITSQPHGAKSYPVRSKRMVNNIMLVVNNAAEEHPLLVVAAYWMMGKNSSATRVYCDVKIRLPGGSYRYGAGFVGGGGYHKESAALQEALDNAGFSLFDGANLININGAGERAMIDALLDIARLLYPDHVITRF